MSLFKSFFKLDLGVTAIEYALIVSFIAVAIIAAVTLVGTQLSPIFNTVASSI